MRSVWDHEIVPRQLRHADHIHVLGVPPFTNRAASAHKERLLAGLLPTVHYEQPVVFQHRVAWASSPCALFSRRVVLGDWTHGQDSHATATLLRAAHAVAAV